MEDLQKNIFYSEISEKEFFTPTALWHKVAGNDISKKHADNHFGFFEEESVEYLDAIRDEDYIEKWDAIGDMLFVAYGNAYHNELKVPYVSMQMSVMYAIKEVNCSVSRVSVLIDVFREVVSSNFSKFCKSEEEAKATKEFYKKEKGVDVIYDKVEDFYVIRSSKSQIGDDGKEYKKDKILKSINFKHPRIEFILKEYNLI